jgi:hypothetical protein
MPKQPPVLFLSVKLNADLKTPDELLADYFLWGNLSATFGLFRREYPEIVWGKYPQKAIDERLAREALLRVLRSPEPLSRTLRSRLAELFDPQSKIAQRQLVFKRRGRGKPASISNKQVADYVDRLARNGTKKAAVAAAIDQFGLSRKQIYAKLKATQHD